MLFKVKNMIVTDSTTSRAIRAGITVWRPIKSPVNKETAVG